MVWIWKPLLVGLIVAVTFLPCQGQDSTTQTRLEMARTLLDSGKIDESIVSFSKLLESGPSSLALYYRGMAYSMKGYQGLAIKDFSDAIAIDPNQSVFYARRGISRLSLGDTSEAISDLDRAIELEPASSSVLSFRARAMMMSKRTNQAIEDINRAIQIAPNNPGFYKLRGDILTSAGNYENAVQDYDRAIQQNPGFASH